jgi:hypothetical protein
MYIALNAKPRLKPGYWGDDEKYQELARRTWRKPVVGPGIFLFLRSSSPRALHIVS